MADFYDLFNKPEPPPRLHVVASTPAGDIGPYVAAVCQTIIDAPRPTATTSGARNDTLNRAAYTLGRLVGGGQLEYFEAADALTQAAKAAGLEDFELGPTIRSGLKAGQAEPRTLAELNTEAPPVTVLTEVAEEYFWTTRPELDHVRTFARARMCSPWAVLGVVLARVITAVPPFVVLPAIVGSEASLNLFVALVGPSGTGKGAGEAAAADAVDVGNIEVAHVGSGEGIAHLYAHREKGSIVRDRDAVLFGVPEVDSLTALTGRQGATLLPQLRMAWSGERLGFAYVDRSKNLPIERHTYRLALLLGVQPGRAAPLLEDSDGGTPQRFVWLPTTDPDAPAVPPTEPDPLLWAPPGPPWLSNTRGLSVLGVPDEARRTIVDARLARLRNEGDALDGHALLARLKLAAALALFDQRRDVNDEDWGLSETIMAVSDATRKAVQKHLAAKNQQVNIARGEAEADRAVFVADKLDKAQVTRVCKVITRALRRSDGQWMSRRDVAHVIASRDRTAVDDALGNLLDAGQVEAQINDDKTLYRISEKAS